MTAVANASMERRNQSFKNHFPIKGTPNQPTTLSEKQRQSFSFYLKAINLLVGVLI